MQGSLREKILSVVNTIDSKSDSKCGISAIDLSRKINEDYAVVRIELNNLYKGGVIKIREGANNYLIFKNQK